MEFEKYMHIERLGTDEVENIEKGNCYVFYKIDGTNGQVYLNNKNKIECGSRTRVLTLEKDNQGFMEYIVKNDNIKNYLQKHPTHRLYGEWLVPHSLKTYCKEAWKHFYVFDVALDTGELLPYEIYKPLLYEFELDYIPPICMIKNPSQEQLINCLEKTGQFLVEDGQGKGEGIVIKNYNYYNKYGRQTWAKIVCNEFKEKHIKAMGVNVVNGEITTEEKIAEEFCTESFIEKEYAKIVNSNNGWKSKYIPELLCTIWHEFIKEESWNFIKKFKNPKVDYKYLNSCVINKIKVVKKDIF